MILGRSAGDHCGTEIYADLGYFLCVTKTVLKVYSRPALTEAAEASLSLEPENVALLFPAKRDPGGTEHLARSQQWRLLAFEYGRNNVGR